MRRIKAKGQESSVPYMHLFLISGISLISKVTAWGSGSDHARVSFRISIRLTVVNAVIEL